MLTNVLEQAGFRVDQASNGYMGLKRALADRVDVVLMDLCLAEVSGAVVISTLRSSHPTRQVPILLLCDCPSALSEGPGGALEEADVDGVVARRVEAADVLDQVARACFRRAQHATGNNDVESMRPGRSDERFASARQIRADSGKARDTRVAVGIGAR
jgi:DNA-binding response OmpR family regulator